MSVTRNKCDWQPRGGAMQTATADELSSTSHGRLKSSRKLVVLPPVKEEKKRKIYATVAAVLKVECVTFEDFEKKRQHPLVAF